MQPQGFPERPASIKDAAATHHVHPNTLRRRIAKGELTAYRLGSQIIRIDLDEVDKLFTPAPRGGAE